MKVNFLYLTSKIVHFTDLTSQPWLFHHSPVSSTWEKFFLEAVDEAFLSKDEIIEAYSNKWISRRIMTLAQMNDQFRQPINSIWRNWNTFGFLLLRFCRQFIELIFWKHQGQKLKSLLSKFRYASFMMRG
jgi:hypothetical protein